MRASNAYANRMRVSNAIQWDEGIDPDVVAFDTPHRRAGDRSCCTCRPPHMSVSVRQVHLRQRQFSCITIIFFNAAEGRKAKEVFDIY